MRFTLSLTVGGHREDLLQQRFDALIAQDWARFWRYALRLCHGNADDAEDLLSETLIDAFRAFDRFRGESFDRWVFRMITTNHLDMLRRAKVRPTIPLSALDNSEGRAWEARDRALSVEEQVLGSDLSCQIASALAQLPENFRVPLVLCDLEGLEYEEIAETLQIPLGTVRSRIHRARQRMREALLASGEFQAQAAAQLQVA